MFSGSTLTKMSGRVMGAHQKIDRVARHHLSSLINLNNDKFFPSVRKILQFEGKNGPDGIKRKSPGKDEPWHFYNPFDDADSRLIGYIDEHYKQLVDQLRSNNTEKASFEAAWLAHALVDGLTPAHHYPYEEELTGIRGSGEDRISLKEKIVMPGGNNREKVKNNWKMWGPKGLFTNHYLFEWGVAAIIAPLTFSDTLPSREEIENVMSMGIVEYFRRSARDIARLDMYDRYSRRGWTAKLSLDVRHKLAPTILKVVTLAWYSAMIDAGLAKVET